MITCAGCGKEFQIMPCEATIRKYCSAACLKQNKKARIICEVCGKVRRVTPTQLAEGARFCSWNCARMVLNQPRPVVICVQCGKASAVPPSRVKQGMRFCSHSCRTIWTLTHLKKGRTTAIEAILYQTLDHFGIDYIAQHPILEAHTVVDAYLPKHNVVIYADGDYWHSLPRTVLRDKRQNAKLTELGYRIYRIPEHVLNKDPVTALLPITQL